MMRFGFPIAAKGQVIGLLGGSFDPAHDGHVLITQEAIKRFGLDRVWWLVSPGNPLKEKGPAALEQRMERAHQVMRDPRVVVTDIESRLGTRYTAASLHALRRHYPGVRFIWLMGADNLVQFDKWHDWQSIAQSTPLAILARPGQRLPARLSRSSRILMKSFVKHKCALRKTKAPAWCFADIPMSKSSSSQLRKAGKWPV